MGAVIFVVVMVVLVILVAIIVSIAEASKKGTAIQPPVTPKVQPAVIPKTPAAPQKNRVNLGGNGIDFIVEYETTPQTLRQPVMPPQVLGNLCGDTFQVTAVKEKFCVVSGTSKCLCKKLQCPANE